MIPDYLFFLYFSVIVRLNIFFKSLIKFFEKYIPQFICSDIKDKDTGQRKYFKNLLSDVRNHMST